MNPLRLLHEHASKFSAEFSESQKEVEGSANCRIVIRMPDNREVLFNLKLTQQESLVSVKESSCNSLPTNCPERHINSDGSFCLGYGGEEALEVVDKESAFRWWGRLVSYLTKQIRVSKSRVWPGDYWFHGGAAKYQTRLNECAKELGIFFINGTKTNAFEVKRGTVNLRSNEPALRLYYESKLIIAVWQRLDMVANANQPCICADVRHHKIVRRSIKKCVGHAKTITEFIKLIWIIQQEEEAFWNNYKEKSTKCCGTMDKCPLAN